MSKTYIHLIGDPIKCQSIQSLVNGMDGLIAKTYKSFGADISLEPSQDYPEVVAVVGVDMVKQSTHLMSELSRTYPVLALLNREECGLSKNLCQLGIFPAYWNEGAEELSLAVEQVCFYNAEKSTLNKKINELSSKLEQRKWLDRTKGMLMDEHKMNEKDSYHFIQRAAMDNNVSMQTICENLLSQKG